MRKYSLKAMILLAASMLLISPTFQTGSLVISPVSAATPSAQNPLITTSNVDQLRLVATVGRGYVTQLAWSPDNSILAVATSQGVWIYDVNALDRLPWLIKGYSSGVWISPDAHRLANKSRQEIDVYDTSTWQQVGTLPTGELAVAFSKDWLMLFTGSETSGTALWRTSDGQLIRKLEARPVEDNSQVSFSPDNSLLAFNQGFGPPNVISVATGNEVIELARNPYAGPIRIRCLTFSPDGRTLIVGNGVPEGSDAGDQETGNYIQAWAITTGKLLFSVEDNGLRVGGIAYSPDGKTIASGSDDGTVRLRDPQTGFPRLTLAGGKHLAFSPDSSQLATNNEVDGTIQIYDSNTGAMLTDLGGFSRHYLWGNADPSSTTVKFSPDLNQVAFIDTTSNLRLWDIPSMTLRTLETEGLTRTFAFSPDSRVSVNHGFGKNVDKRAMPAKV